MFDVFKIGVGPSSSHTMGPMLAAGRFLRELAALPELTPARITVELFGSLALTGRGHATDRAVLLGLLGRDPRTLDPDAAEGELAALARSGRLPLPGGREVEFDRARDLVFIPERRPEHPNALRFRALDGSGRPRLERLYLSIGGGAVRDASRPDDDAADPASAPPPHPFASAAELLARADAAGLSIARLAAENETAALGRGELEARLDEIVAAMMACVDRGLRQEGVLPGGLNVERRAPRLLERIAERRGRNTPDPLEALDWINLWALAVNEENAAGGRVVTAPTNGAAGVIPAVLRYWMERCGGDAAGAREFLLTAGAVGALYKTNASISGAEVGCQGEVGVACSMAAAGLAAVLGATNAQIENAAEIGMEHNLGLTCDPIGGLVQIPCIERNAMAAVKAVDAARLALLGDGRHTVSLDTVISTMKRTGQDMSEIYKETSLGGLAAEFGLAVNMVEC